MIPRAVDARTGLLMEASLIAMKRPLLIGLIAFAISTLALVVFGFVTSDRFARLPDPTQAREAFAKADSVALRVSGTSLPGPTGLFLKDRDKLETLARLLIFDQPPTRSTGARYGTTDSIQARIIREGQPPEIFNLIGGRALLYGPEGKYTAHLKDDQFDRAIRALINKAGAPAP